MTRAMREKPKQATRTFHERLSGQDASFIAFETPRTPMHVSALSILEPGPILRASGGIDFRRVRDYVASRLHLIPRYRQRIEHTPVDRYPVWVDDAQFDIDLHVCHIAVPRGSGTERLKKLVAWLISQPLDLRRPPWELWLIEGLDHGRFALLNKVHHCMIDGSAGVELLGALLRPTPETSLDPAPAWKPRPAPNQTELLYAETVDRLRQPLHFAEHLAANAKDIGSFVGDLGASMQAAWNLFRSGVPGAPQTLLNQNTGPQRAFDWLSVPLDALKAIKNALGGTVNDVALAIVTGAIRRYLSERHTDVSHLDFRTVVPVDTRTAPPQRQLGNCVSAWIVSLPIGERDPKRRFESVSRLTTQMRLFNQARGGEFLVQVGEWLGFRALSVGVKLTNLIRPYNLIVSNVRGPNFPLYFVGSRMLCAYPALPLFEAQGLGVAMFSYDGSMDFGFVADRDQVRDLPRFVTAFRRSLSELKRAAAVVPRQGTRRAPRPLTIHPLPLSA
jgi:WS/DGAT/MGAT family acyltransferase